MNRKIVTLLLAAGALVGVSSAASAQVKGRPWQAVWDTTVRMSDSLARHLPNHPAGPGFDSTRIRLYAGHAVTVDTAFVIPGGKNRRIVYKDMPKDHLGRHYIVNAMTGQIYTEFDTIKLPDSNDTTVLSLNFKHLGLSEGEPTYVDGYEGQIQLQVKVGNRWSGTAYQGAFETIESVKYQFFNLPGYTKLTDVQAGPKEKGRFSLRWTGELVNQDPIAYIDSSQTPPKQYAYPAYYSFDGGATWLPCTTDGIDLNPQEVSDLPENFKVWVRLPNGPSYVAIETYRGPIAPPVVSRQVTIENKTTDAQIEPKRQIYDVNSNTDFTFKVRPSGTNVPKISTSRNSKIADKSGVTTVNNGDGTYTVTVRRVQENLTVTLEYEANANVEATGNRVWSENGQLYVTSAAAGRANVYNVLGKLNRSLTLSAGETKSVSVPAGIYVVSLNNGKAYKVSVR